MRENDKKQRIEIAMAMMHIYRQSYSSQDHNEVYTYLFRDEYEQNEDQSSLYGENK